MFGIGQKVRVKDFSELADKYGITDGGIVIGDYMFEKAMKVYCGEEYRVLSHFEDNTYELDTNDNENWVFHEEVLELPNHKKNDNLKQENILLKAELERAKNRIKELEEAKVVFETVDYCSGDLEVAFKENDRLKEENERLKAQLKAEIKPTTDEIQDDIIDDIKPKKRAYNRKKV